MSSTHDVVELAIGNVRVPPHLLTSEQREKLFAFYQASISRHYYVHRGGSNFVPWFERSFGHRDSRDMSLEQEHVEIAKAKWPGETEYNVKTRIAPMYMQKFLQPDLSLPRSCQWKEFAEAVCVRLCLTQDGTLYLEWYEGVHTNSSFKVKSADYSPVNIGSKRLDTIIEKDPHLLSRFGHQVLFLLDADATERERRAARDRKLFNELNLKGKLFDITTTPRTNKRPWA